MPATLSVWLLASIVAVAVGIVMAVRRGPHVGVGAAAAIGLLAPNWAYLQWGLLEFDVKLTAVAVMLLAYCVHPRGKLRFPVTFVDVVITAIFVTHLVSEAFVGDLDGGGVLRAFGEWYAPFLAGRGLGLYRGGLSAIAPWFAVATIVLAAGAWYESLTNVNPWEALFAPVDDLVDRLREARYGFLYRAAGPTRHPIFLAIVFLLMTPWAVMTAERHAQHWRIIGWVALACVPLGVVSTVSRGPLAALALGGIVWTLIRFERQRIWIGGAVVATALGLVAVGDRAADWISQTDSVRGKGELVVIDGQSRTYTPTMNRVLVWEIYAPLVGRGGPLGYGTDRVSSFPPDLPLPVDGRSAEILGIVDNSYLLFGLRFGWVGLALLVTLLAGAVVTAVRLRASAGMVAYPFGAVRFEALAAVLTAVAAQMLLVFCTYEFVFWLLMTVGVVSGSESLRRRMVRGDDVDSD